MARGLPDYSSDKRPRYGGAYLTGQQTKVTVDDYTDLITVSGKGMIYGGIVWLDYTYSQANDEVFLQIDGFNIGDMSFLRLHEYAVLRARTFPITLNRYDGVKYIYSVGISYGITFETQVKVIYHETYGRDPTVFSRLVYALI